MSVPKYNASLSVLHRDSFDGHGSTLDSYRLISDTVIIIFQYVMITVICQFINIFGVGTNIINIMCFAQQGFNDSVNISLLGLAISDLGCLTTLIWGSVFFTPDFIAADLPFIPTEVTYLTSGIPHTTFTRITGWITALITLERCLCITAPLKVSAILTPKRMSIVVGCVFVILTVSVSPVYAVNWLGPKFVLHKNTTLIGLVFREDRETIEKFTFIVNNAFVPFTSFVIIIICTLILVIQLRKQIKWRQKTSKSEQANTISNRNQKVAKMVLVISTLFIICFIPMTGTFIAMSVEPKLSIDGKYMNVLTLLGGVCIVLESVNSSVNIFVYYHMSSRYKLALRKMLCLDE